MIMLEEEKAPREEPWRRGSSSQSVRRQVVGPRAQAAGAVSRH